MMRAKLVRLRFALILFLFCIPVAGHAAEGRIPIFDTIDITAPGAGYGSETGSGSYIVTNDFVAAPGSSAITIEVSHVSIDLDGHTIFGQPGFSIIVNDGVATDIHITNGKLVNGEYAIDLSGTGQFSVEDVTMVSNNGSEGKGLRIVGSGGNARVVVRRNSIVNSPATGIDLQNVDDGRITENDIRSGFTTAQGIYLSAANNTIISQNSVTNCFDAGIYLAACYNNLVTDNTASLNIAGATAAGIRIDGTSNTILDRNTVAGNDVGIYLTNGQQCTISNNNASGNITTHGIWLSGSSDNYVHHNTVSQNTGDGIHVDATSGCNVIDWNSGTTNIGFGLNILSPATNQNTFTFNRMRCNNGNGVQINDPNGNNPNPGSLDIFGNIQ